MHSHSHSHHPPHVLRTFARRKDPTNTQRIRVRFEKEVNRRFADIKRLIRKALLTDDVFGLQVRTNAAVSPGARAFEFLRLDEKVPAFMEWLKAAEDQAIFSVTPGTSITQATKKSWANLYIESAYQKGMAQAAANLRGQGVPVADTWLDSAFFRPVHADRVGLIYTRTYSDLVGVTDQMDTIISRVLARGIGEGRNPRDIARDLAKQVDISRSRARTIARTEVISAHAEASLNSYKEAGVEGVQVQAEWSTAGDDAVCPECEAMEGKEFDIDDARGLIPLHPNCRCAFIPVVLGPNGQSLEDMSHLTAKYGLR